MKKILFFDIDGTIMDHGYIPKSCIDAISLAQKNGHYCFINTGRPYSTVPSTIKDFGFDGFVCGCGTYVILHNQVIYHNIINETIRKQTQALLFSSPIDIALEGSKEACFITQVNCDEFKKCSKDFINEFDLHIYQEGELLDFDKMTLFFNKGEDISKLRSDLSKHFEIIDRDDTFIEVMPLNHSKATGINEVLKHLNMSIEDTISFGDSSNDLAMLKHTKESVAMGNSNKEILPFVTYVTDTLENDGIYKAMKHFNLI